MLLLSFDRLHDLVVLSIGIGCLSFSVDVILDVFEFPLVFYFLDLGLKFDFLDLSGRFSTNDFLSSVGLSLLLSDLVFLLSYS